MVKGHTKTCPKCGRDGWMQLIDGNWKFLEFKDSAALRWEAHDCNRLPTGRTSNNQPGPKFHPHGKSGGERHPDLNPNSRPEPKNRAKPFFRIPKSWKFGFKAKAEEEDGFDEEFSDEWS